jgi:organic radical activating enzyme
MLSKEIQLEVNKGAMLPLMEEFYTIQGEGFHTGTAAYFVRIGGWMWVVIGVMLKKWNAELHPSSINQIVSNAKKYSETVVVTGSH